ncbi:glycosyltransferase family 2 protein [Candidatus Woesebacteria bacterium]|nr:glycosyltransferase family 2 protein [Candidatus Woesebacteria bacterium]
MSKKVDLEIIILTYNSGFWLKKTLSTLHEFFLLRTKLDCKVTVVDNNSEDNTLEVLRSEFPWVETLSLSTNLGFSNGNNQALKQSNSRYALLLNSDMQATTETNFDTLVAFMDKEKKVGISTPKIEFLNGDIDPACHRGEPTLWSAFTYFSGLAKLFPKTKLFAQYHQTYKDFSSIHTIDACSGAAMMIRTTLLKEVGLLDERFFMYAEDLDLCRRSRDAGYLIAYNPGVRIIHHKYKSGIRGSSKKIARETRQHFYDTMLQYYDKHYAKQYPAFVRWLIHAVLVAKKGAL